MSYHCTGVDFGEFRRAHPRYLQPPNRFIEVQDQRLNQVNPRCPVQFRISIRHSCGHFGVSQQHLLGLEKMVVRPFMADQFGLLRGAQVMHFDWPVVNRWLPQLFRRWLAPRRPSIPSKARVLSRSAMYAPWPSQGPNKIPPRRGGRSEERRVGEEWRSRWW